MIAYRFAIFSTSTRSGTENRFLANLSYKLPGFLNISQSISQRTELRYFNKIIDDHLRIRLRYILSRRLDIANKKFVPNLSYELFWDDIANQINRQRVYAGISTEISSIFVIRLNIIGQYDNGRKSIYILNTGLNMSL
jgi:hypothetical protein